MCIIAVKPANAKKPDKNTLKIMFERNPDGAGIAYAKNGVLTIKKGLMSFKDFLSVAEKIDNDAVVVYHFRITTSGGTCKELTHPFLLSADINKMRALESVGADDVAVFHNGIFNEFSFKALNNDTTQFVSNYLAPLNELKKAQKKSIFDADLRLLINQLVDGSRLALIGAGGELALFGAGWRCEDGVYYSNTSYKAYKTPIFSTDFDDFCAKYQNFNISKKDLKTYFEALKNG